MNKKTNHLPLLLLPVIIAICFTLWSAEQSPLPWTKVESDTAVFDARHIDFTQNIISFNRCVEYVDGVMLTPEEFSLRDDTQVGRVPDESEVCTMRIKILVPDDRVYGIAGYPVNYASSVYVNGKWLFDEGKPAYTLETEQSSEAYRVFSASPIDGEIEIVVQTSSFANIDTASSMGWCLGDYDSLRVFTARKTTIDVIIMSWYALLAVVALLLFLVLPKYTANGWLALLAATWVIRTGLKNTKFLLTLFPDHTWNFVYKVEIMTSFVTIILFVLIMNSVFPKSLPKWLSGVIIGANFAAIAYIILMPWQTFLGHSTVTNPIVYWALGLLCIFAVVDRIRTKASFTLAQIVHLSGTVLVLAAFMWDQGYFKYELFPWSVTQPTMLVFSMFMMVGAMLATMQKTTQREVTLVQTVEVQEKQLIQRELELSESRTASMLSQIQPHFLYNSLTAIKNLCRYDLAEGLDTIDSFSDYLRGNLDSLTKKTPVTFEEELEHVRAYLALEEKRFEGRLRVEYALKAEVFLLPALTVQPIVENAVRHGIAEKPGGGTIRLSTEETDDCYKITIADDGIGFDPAAEKNDGRSHTGIANVRDRLGAMCGGTLLVESRPEEGTTMTILLPKLGES